MASTQDKYLGCLLGLAMGDTLGAPHEGGPLERTLWRLIGRTRQGLPRWTDDTQMSLDLAESLLKAGKLDQDELACRFAHSYVWHRGYGPSTARVLKKIRRGLSWQLASKAIHKTGSFGNGAAMRASVLALFFAQEGEALIAEARKAAEVTHSHPLGIEGGVLMAVATQQLLRGASELETLTVVASHCAEPEFRSRLDIAKAWLQSGAQPTAQEVAKRLGNGMSAHTSAVTALYIALRHLTQRFDNMMAFVIACKGDVDAIGAMAGTLWGSCNGAAALPEQPLEQRPRIVALANQLQAR